MRPKFSLGKLVATPGAIEVLQMLEVPISTLIDRHVLGDWGDMPKDDKELNDDALKHGGRLMSSYHLEDDIKIWIITEVDRSYTTVLLPSEY